MILARETITVAPCCCLRVYVSHNTNQAKYQKGTYSEFGGVEFKAKGRVDAEKEKVDGEIQEDNGVNKFHESIEV